MFQLKRKETLIAINRFNKRNAHFVLDKKSVLMEIKDHFEKTKLNVLIFKVSINILFCVDKNLNAYKILLSFANFSIPTYIPLSIINA